MTYFQDADFRDMRENNKALVRKGLQKARQENRTIFQCMDYLTNSKGHAMIWTAANEVVFEYGEETVIEIVEKEGWKLEAQNLIFRPTTMTSRDKFLQSGQDAAQDGEVILLMTFRASEKLQNEMRHEAATAAHERRRRP